MDTTECGFAQGTKITLASGEEKNIEDIKPGEIIMTYDHENGCFSESEVQKVLSGAREAIPFTAIFESGVRLSIASGYGFFEKYRLKYIDLTDKNTEIFLSSRFYNHKEDKMDKFVGIIREKKEVRYYSVLTKNAQNYFANGILCACNEYIDELNEYELHEDLKAYGLKNR